jgi:hypothetical protein
LSPLIFNFALQYAFGKVKANQEEYKLDGIHQVLLNADNNLLRKNTYTRKKNTESLLVAGKEICPELNKGKLNICLCLMNKVQVKTVT